MKSALRPEGGSIRIALPLLVEPVCRSRQGPSSRFIITEQQKALMGCLTAALLSLSPGLTPLHCAVVAHNAVVHELQRNQQPHSPEVQELLLKNKSLVDTIKCLIQMGAAVEAKVSSQGSLEVGWGKVVLGNTLFLGID